MELNYGQEQHSAAWYRDRLGCITGSRVGVLMKKGRGAEPFSQTARTYLYQVAGERALAAEIKTDEKMLQFYVEQTNVTSKAMRFGSEQEENARSLYAALTMKEVREVGLCRHPSIEGFASSPDGIVTGGGAKDDSFGCLEIKCPGVSAFAQYVAEIKDAPTLLAVNPDYYYQCMAHMACTGAAYCDFVAYCPFMASPIHIVRIDRDPQAITAMENAVAMAEEVVDGLLTKLRA